MLIVRCRDCNTELSSNSSRAQCCGCSNMLVLKGDSISAIDLSRVVIVNSTKEIKKKEVLTTEDIAWQEARRLRKVKKLDFEIR